MGARATPGNFCGIIIMLIFNKGFDRLSAMEDFVIIEGVNNGYEENVIGPVSCMRM